MSIHDRGQHRSLAVRNWHREALDHMSWAYDLDCGGEFSGKCSACLLDLYVWEDSRDPARATAYTKETARSLGVPGFFIHFDCDESDRLLWMRVQMIYPEKVEIGDADDFRAYLIQLRRTHEYTHHKPQELLARFHATSRSAA